MEREQLLSWLLRTGLAFAFFYVALSSLIRPEAWIGFIPFFIRDLIPELLLNVGLAVSHVGLGAWLLTGWKTFYAAIASAVVLTAIVLFNISALDIVFRDISLIFMAATLAILSKK